MTEKQVDYIIVGQGLAGSCLALHLLLRKKRVLIVDEPNPNAASVVAAGLFNPITGRQMGKTWLADDLFPYLHQFYSEAEKFLQQQFFFPMPLYRPFVTVEEQNEWMGRSADDNYTAYLSEVNSRPVHEQIVKNPFGGLMLKQCGYLDTHIFLKAVRHYFQSTGSVVTEPFDEEALDMANGVRYRGWGASKVIFCAGEKARSSRYFSWLPVRPLKGETLSVSPDVKPSIILNRGVYVVPGIWKVGATYNKHDQAPGNTEAGFRELKEKLDELAGFSYAITGREWGFRPTTPDRRPILGPHPEFEQLIIFNGLGTKGVSLAPYFSNVLTNWLESGAPINQSVSVSRYKSVYSKST
ncbi:MAG: FAD-dependent oxidoreductase [Cyclobacteriaceae bacterium]|nr:FAD-dependent oxidoreductase [Cyclobacteriaceae bacterium]